MVADVPVKIGLMQAIDRDQQDMLGVRVARIIVIGVRVCRQTTCQRGKHGNSESFLGGHGFLLWIAAIRRPGHASLVVCPRGDPPVSLA